jgi:hypothetical protein
MPPARQPTFSVPTWLSTILGTMLISLASWAYDRIEGLKDRLYQLEQRVVLNEQVNKSSVDMVRVQMETFNKDVTELKKDIEILQTDLVSYVNMKGRK